MLLFVVVVVVVDVVVVVVDVVVVVVVSRIFLVKFGSVTFKVEKWKRPTTPRNMKSYKILTAGMTL